jgi:hypothetical protein
MAVSQGTLIAATTFNDIQNKVASVLGQGVGDLGYGQVVTSQAVVRGDKITSLNWGNLRTDLIKCRQHQTGLDESGNLSPITDETTITADIVNEFETFTNTVFNERQNIAITPGAGITVQGATSAPLVQKSYSSNWNQKLYLIVTCQFQPFTDGPRQFTASDSARHFFNAGGEIRLQLDIDNVNSKKEEEYQQMFDDFGVVRIRANDTTNGTGTTNRGFNQLTTSDQQVWNMAGRGYYYYAYSNNDIIVTAQTNASKSQVIVTIELRDDDYGNIDEPVDATITGTVTTLQPIGDNVALDNPTFTSTNWSGSYTAPTVDTSTPPPPPPPPSGSAPNPSVSVGISGGTGTVSWNRDTGTYGIVRVTGPTGQREYLNSSISASGAAQFTSADYGIYTAEISSTNAYGTGTDSDSASKPQPANTFDFPTPTPAGQTWPITVTGTPGATFSWVSSSPDIPGYNNQSETRTLNSNGVWQTTGYDSIPGTVTFTVTFTTGSPASITKTHIAT